MLVHLIALRSVFVLLVPPIAAVVGKLLFPRRKMLISGRAALFLISTMLLGPGLMVNVALKDHWGRPRPIDIAQYGGNQHFVAWWDPRGDCPANCSFVSGDVATAAWTVAPAALAPPQWRLVAYGAAFAFTAAMAAMRITAGGHFLTDTVFAGVFTFLLVWLVHGLLYRWRTRISDAAIEGAIARITLPVYDFLAGLFAGKREPKA
jgi:membrane-associated PAP2 superfamily phosphatase